MQRQHGDYLVDDSRQRFDVPRVQGWMLTTYWWRETATPEAIARACRHSAMLIGAYLGGDMVGCCRIVSDMVRFAWVADVYVEPSHRRKGLARAMVAFALDHPELASVQRFLLATKDAHDVYAGLGFAPPDDVAWLMQRRIAR